MAESPVPPSVSASTSSATPAAPRPGRPGLLYHSSQQDRIDQILETARRRSEAMEASRSLPQSVSPSQSARLSDHEGEGTESSDADERTSIMQRQSSKKSTYQSTSSNLATSSSGMAYRRPASDRQTQQPVPESSDPDDQQSWWRRQVEKIGAIELDNKGSVARDHLALERTFLAWLRTSLAFASIGIAITQLFRLNTSISNPDSSDESTNDPYYSLRQVGKPLGATFLGISILVLFVGFHRYFESQHWITKGKFPASRGSIAFVAFVALAVMVASLIIVIVVEPNTFEN